MMRIIRIMAVLIAGLPLLALVPRHIGAEQRRAPAGSRGPNPVIRKIVSEISRANLEAIVRKLASFETRHTMSETEIDIRGIGAARRWIKSEMDRYSRDSGGKLIVEFDEHIRLAGGRVQREVKVVNVVATLPGSLPESKDRIYIVSGHYDSRASNGSDATSPAPGANDDASGTAAVMEMARVMSKYDFDATVVFMTVAGEEQGLLGAHHWAESARKKSLNIRGMITNDIIGNSRAEDGRIDRTQVRLFAEGIPRGELTPDLRALLDSGGENDLPTRQLARYIKETGENYVPGLQVSIVYRRDRFGRGGDHSAFLDRGYPAVRFTEPNEDFRRQHQNVRIEDGVQYGDLPQFVDYNYLTQVTRVNAAALASMALGPASPKQVEIETRPGNDTNLRWEANAESDLAGYQIVWRKTTAPFWEQRRQIGNVTRYTMRGLSKDNYLFGVQAVDKDGNLSIAVYPRPARQRLR
jgi:hypothetical protein